MADITYTYKKTGGSKAPVVTPPSPSPNIIDGLTSSCIKTQVIGQSFKIVRGGVLIGNFSNNTVSGWKKVGSSIEILSISPTTLNFINISEATAAEIRLAGCLNGGLIV